MTGSLPDKFGELVDLKEVDIRYNTLSSIGVIARLPKVELISADHNFLSICRSEFRNVCVLRLRSNPVKNFEISTPVLTLTTLIMSNAMLGHIPNATFDKMPNLVKLVLDKNCFVSLPSNIGKLRKLEYFSITRNTLSSLPAEIGCLTELRFLDIRQNNLKELPIEIWWANKLEHLNISSNMLAKFPKPASRFPAVAGNISSEPGTSNGSSGQNSNNSCSEEIGSLEASGQLRPSQTPSALLSVGGVPAPRDGDRNDSVVSMYGKEGRKTPVVSGSTVRKDSGILAKLINTFAGSLRNLSLADNELDDDVFDEITRLLELQVLNLSYNN